MANSKFYFDRESFVLSANNFTRLTDDIDNQVVTMVKKVLLSRRMGGWVDGCS